MIIMTWIFCSTFSTVEPKIYPLIYESFDALSFITEQLFTCLRRAHVA
jgi:hypothetical protein